MTESRKQRKCGCVADASGRRYWKHTLNGLPEVVLCERFGGCSHPCTHTSHRTMRRRMPVEGVEPQ